MTLTKARALRDSIRKRGLHCTVPLGYGPDGYFAQIVTMHGPHRLHSADEWEEYQEGMAARERQHEEAVRVLEGRRLSRPQSPLDRMIDQACGITEKDYR